MLWLHLPPYAQCLLSPYLMMLTWQAPAQHYQLPQDTSYTPNIITCQPGKITLHEKDNRSQGYQKGDYSILVDSHKYKQQAIWLKAIQNTSISSVFIFINIPRPLTLAMIILFLCIRFLFLLVLAYILLPIFSVSQFVIQKHICLPIMLHSYQCKS